MSPPSEKLGNQKAHDTYNDERSPSHDAEQGKNPRDHEGQNPR